MSLSTAPVSISKGSADGLGVGQVVQPTSMACTAVMTRSGDWLIDRQAKLEYALAAAQAGDLASAQRQFEGRVMDDSLA